MALWRRTASFPPAQLHAALGSAAGLAIAEAAGRGDLAEVQQRYLASAPGERSLLIQVVEQAVPKPLLARWLEQEPGSALAWGLLGAQTATAAADARGGDKYEHTPQAQITSFQHLMGQAREQLDHAVGLDDRDPGLHYLRLTTAYSMGRATLFHDLGELRRRSPHDVEGLRTALDLLGEKWYGEAGEARALADEVRGSAPDGSEAHVVSAFVLRDEWFYAVHFRDDARGGLTTLQSPRSRTELLGALDASLRSAAHRATEVTTLVRNHFAHVCMLAGEKDAAREQFAALDGVVTRWPWEIWGNPVKEYVRVRAI